MLCFCSFLIVLIVFSNVIQVHSSSCPLNSAPSSYYALPSTNPASVCPFSVREDPSYCLPFGIRIPASPRTTCLSYWNDNIDDNTTEVCLCNPGYNATGPGAGCYTFYDSPSITAVFVTLPAVGKEDEYCFAFHFPILIPFSLSLERSKLWTIL